MKQMIKMSVKGVLTKVLLAMAVLKLVVADGKTCGSAIDGEMKNGIRTFAIDMSLYGKVDGSRRTELEKAKYYAVLTNFAYVVYEATDGLHRIGRIDVWVDNGGVKYSRDIEWIKTLNDKNDTTAAKADVRTEKESRGQITIGDQNKVVNDILAYPATAGAIIAHEWCHLTYGLYDEYSDKLPCKSFEYTPKSDQDYELHYDYKIDDVLALRSLPLEDGVVRFEESSGDEGNPYFVYVMQPPNTASVVSSLMSVGTYSAGDISNMSDANIENLCKKHLNLSVPIHAEDVEETQKSIPWVWKFVPRKTFDAGGHNLEYRGAWKLEVVKNGTEQSFCTGQSCWEQLIKPNNVCKGHASTRLGFPGEYFSYTPEEYSEFNDLQKKRGNKYATVELSSPAHREKAVKELNIVWHEEAPRNCTVLCCDGSTSMSEDDFANVRHAAQMLLGSVPEETVVGVVLFSDEVETLMPLTVVTEENRKALQNKVASMSQPHGSTALWNAAWSALDQIALFNADSAGNASIMLLTDGGNNVPPTTKEQVVARCKEMGVAFNSIAYGDAADSSLRAVSDETGGAHYKSDQDPSELAQTFQRTFASSSARVVLADQIYETTKPTKIQKSFFVDSILTNVQMSVGISTASYDDKITFLSPSGVSHVGEELVSGSNRSVMYRMPMLEVGEWTIKVEANEPTRITVYADGNILSTATPELRVEVSRSDGVVYATLRNGHSITGAYVVASIPCRGHVREIVLEENSWSGQYSAPLLSLGPEAMRNGFTVSATMRANVACLNLDDGFVCDSGDSGFVMFDEDVTRATYVSIADAGDGFDDIDFEDGGYASNVTVSNDDSTPGVIDISYVFNTYQECVAAFVTVTGTDSESGTRVMARAISGDGVDSPAEKGVHRIRWDVKTDYQNYKAGAFDVSLKIEPIMLPDSVVASWGTSTESVELSWVGNNNGVTYQIWRNKIDNSDSATLVGTSTSTAFTDTTATSATIYYYWVRPVVGSWCGGFGSSVAGFRMLPAPEGAIASSDRTDCVVVKWFPSDYTDRYYVYRANWRQPEDAEFIGECFFSLPQSGSGIGPYYVTFTDNTAEVGVRYYYWVKAVGEDKSSLFSSCAEGVRIPGTVANVKASDGDFKHGIAVTWDAVEGAEEYCLYRADANGSFGSATRVGYTERCALYDTGWGITDGMTYRYWVVARSHGTDGKPGDSDTGWSRGSISGDAPYLVIDLSQGPSAERFPCYEMWTRPGMCDWPREYKTEKLVFKRIEPGSFTMGSKSSEKGRRSDDYWRKDESAHDVTIPDAYYIGIFELTIGQDKKIWNSRETSYSGWDEACPAFYMNYWNARGDLSRSVDWPHSSWVQPLSLMGVLRAKTGIATIDLPTEAEWEYACRAGTTTAFNNGSNLASSSPDSDANLDMLARYKANGVDSGVAPVGSFEANHWGLYDMHGNVAEWCLDSYGQSSQNARVLRGGGHADEPRDCRSASRYGFQRKELNDNNGMRVAIRGIVAEVDSGDPVLLIKDGELVACELNGKTDITIPNTVKSIGEAAFYGCYNLKNVNMPNTVTNIGDSAFLYCEGLRKVSVPDSVVSIGDSAFFGCTGLVEVAIGSGLTTIGDWPARVEGGLEYYAKLGEAFCYCSSMVKFVVSSANETFKSVDGMLLTKDGRTLIACPEGKTGRVNVPNGVERIEMMAFDECYNLTAITLPDSLTSIGESDWEWMDVCDTSSIPGVLLVDGWVVGCDYPEPSGKLDLHGIRGIGDSAFSGCDELTAVVIPEGVKTIGEWAFGECRALASVTIPDSVTRIGRRAFAYCNDALYDEESVLGAVVVDGWAIAGSEDASGRLDLRGIRGIVSEAFAMTSFEEVLLPERLSVIDDYVFVCASLTNIVIPSGVVYIGKCGLDCPFLNSIVFNGDAPELADDAFSPLNAKRRTVYVQRGSTGWNVGIPGTWNGMKIAYVGETPDMIRCNVTFDANGGKPAKQTTEQVATTAWSVDGLQTPTKSGSAFGGWYTAKTGGEMVELDGACAFSSDTTLYARWLKSYKATAKNGFVYTDESEEVGSSVLAVNGTMVYLEAADKSANNMDFAYWSYTPATVDLGEGFNPREPYCECIMPEANVTFTANYATKPGYVSVYAYEVNATANDDGEPEGIEWSADGKFWIPAGDDWAFPVKSGKATIKLRSTDPRWTVPASVTCTVENDNTVLDIDVAATRVSVVGYDMEFEQLGATGSVTMSPKNGQVLTGKPVALTAKPGKDTVFAYWMLNGEKVGYAATFKYAPDIDSTVTAVYRLKSAVEDPVLDAGAIVPSANAMVGVAFESQVPLADAAYPAKFSAKGLPAGLKIDAASGVISGVPTKSGSFPVTVTATGGVNAKAKPSVTVPITINPLPEWAQGVFTGYVKRYICEDGACLELADYGSATMTVSANGKISGKATVCGTNWTFSAASYGAASETDAENDGEMTFDVVADAKSGKSVRQVRFSVMKCAAPENGEGTLRNAWAQGGLEACDDESISMRLFRGMWKDKATAVAAKAELANLEGVYTLSLDPGEEGEYGSGYLSLTVGKDGNVKATGKLADGTSVSATSPLLYDGICGDGYFAYLYVAPSAYKGGAFATSVRLGAGGLGCPALPGGAAKWSSRNPLATCEYGEGFDREVPFVGAYYDRLEKLNAYYESLQLSLDGVPAMSYTYKYTYVDDATGRKVTESRVDEAEAAKTLNQEGMTVTVNEKGAIVAAKATKPVQDKETKEWRYEGANDGALTLSFTQATGIFKGSYTFWYDYESAYDETKDKSTIAHTSRKVSFEGVMVQGEDVMRGFYLWDATGAYEDEKTGKEKTYKYKESYPVWLKSP